MQETGNDSARARYLAGWYGTQNERTCPLVENSKPGQLRLHSSGVPRSASRAAAPPPPCFAAPAPSRLRLPRHRHPRRTVRAWRLCVADGGGSGNLGGGRRAGGVRFATGFRRRRRASRRSAACDLQGACFAGATITQTAPAPFKHRAGKLTFSRSGRFRGACGARRPVAAANNGEWDAFGGATPLPLLLRLRAAPHRAAPRTLNFFCPSPGACSSLRLREKCSMTTSSVPAFVAQQMFGANGFGGSACLDGAFGAGQQGVSAPGMMGGAGSMGGVMPGTIGGARAWNDGRWRNDAWYDGWWRFYVWD